MKRPVLVARPLPVQAPTAFVRIRPAGSRICGELRAQRAARCLPAHTQRRR